MWLDDIRSHVEEMFSRLIVPDVRAWGSAGRTIIDGMHVDHVVREDAETRRYRMRGPKFKATRQAWRDRNRAKVRAQSRASYARKKKRKKK